MTTSTKKVSGKKRYLGQYFSKTNVFNIKPLELWKKNIPNFESEILLEPFAGDCDILNYFSDNQWQCYDISPNKENIIQNNSIKNFPEGHKVCITNPPYLAKNSVSREHNKKKKKKKNTPLIKYEDQYLDALEQCLTYCSYVSVIIPSTFINLSKFKDRCLIIDKIDKIAFADTTVPVCVAYFVPEKVKEIKTYVNGERVYLNKHNTPFTINSKILEIKFNSEEGNYVLNGIDSSTKKISINNGINDFNREKYLKQTSRNYVLFKTKDICVKKINNFIDNWREETKDYFLSSFKSPVGDNLFYRKRISFKQLKWIVWGVTFSL